MASNTGCAWAHAEHKAPERVQRSLPPLGGLKHLPLRIGAGRVEQDQKRREVRRERGIEDEKLGRHLLRHGGGASRPAVWEYSLRSPLTGRHGVHPPYDSPPPS